MALHSGMLVPDFSATDSSGAAIDMRALRGRKVLISFFRYASCPLCNLRMHKLILAFPGWQAHGLAVVAIFQSSNAMIARYAGAQDAPFPIVGDPARALYRRFGVEPRWAGLLSLRALDQVRQAWTAGFKPGRIDGDVHAIPADFLVNEDGTIATAHYGRTIDDHLALACIDDWLSNGGSTKHANIA